MINNVRKFVPLIVAWVVIETLLGQSSTGGEWETTFVTFFVAILLEAMPFMLIGALLSGTIEVFVPRSLIADRVPRNRVLAVMLFGLLGMAFPICECGIVPVIRRLLRKGVPLSCGITYLLAAPIVQPVVLVATLVAFNGSWKVAGFRILGGYLVATTVGILSVVVLDPKSKEHIIFDSSDTEPEAEMCSCGCEEEHSHAHSHALVGAACGCGDHHQHDDEHGHHHDHQHEAHADCGCDHELEADHDARSPLAKAEYVLKHAAEDFLSTGSFLIFGAFIAAAMQTFISQSALAGLGHGRIMGPLVMMAMAFTMSLCSAADAFVAAAFTQFSLSARMAFLVMGPMVDIKLVAMYNGFLSRKATVFVFGLASVLAFAYAIAVRCVGL